MDVAEFDFFLSNYLLLFAVFFKQFGAIKRLKITRNKKVLFFQLRDWSLARRSSGQSLFDLAQILCGESLQQALQVYQFQFLDYHSISPSWDIHFVEFKQFFAFLRPQVFSCDWRNGFLFFPSNDRAPKQVKRCSTFESLSPTRSKWWTRHRPDNAELQRKCWDWSW